MPPPPKTPTDFQEILEQIWWRLDSALDLEMLEWSAKLGALEALEAGTTTIIDHNETPNAIEGSLSVIADACAEVGVRVVGAYGVTDRHGADGARRGLEENDRFLRDGGRGMVGVHAAFTCTDDTLAAMAEAGLPLLVHGEVTDPDVDVFDRERVFIERLLGPLAERLPSLRIVLEHVTTADGVRFVAEGREGLAATITPQHLMLNRNALFEGGLRPHRYCLPVLKAEAHRQAVCDAALSGSPRFFLGTDSAPHARHTKETDCGCAGIYSAHAGIELYAEAFDAAGRLERLEGFASRHGPAFYDLPVNTETLTLRREDWTPPASYPAGDDELVPFRRGEKIRWAIVA